MSKRKEGDKVVVWALRVSTLSGGDEFSETAYAEKRTAELTAEELAEEWVSYVPTEVEVTLLNSKQGTFINPYTKRKELVTISDDSSSNIIYRRAVKKLTSEEMDVVVARVKAGVSA